MRRFALLVLLLLSAPLFAGDKYSITAVETMSYRLALNGFVKYDLPSNSWEFEVEGSVYQLLVRDDKILMEHVMEDENVLVLKQPSKLSGYRIFTFFKKTHKFSISETGYVDYPVDALAMGYMNEDVSVSFGDYKLY
jgi:hypothetical protein